MLNSMRCVVHLSTRTLMPFAGIRRGADEENMLRCRGALRCMSRLIPPIIREFTVGFSEACRHTMHAAERVLCRFNLKRLMRERIRGIITRCVRVQRGSEDGAKPCVCRRRAAMQCTYLAPSVRY